MTRRNVNNILLSLVIAWLLSFGDEAKLINPDWLVEEVRGTVKRMQDSYS